MGVPRRKSCFQCACQPRRGYLFSRGNLCPIFDCNRQSWLNRSQPPHADDYRDECTVDHQRQQHHLYAGYGRNLRRDCYRLSYSRPHRVGVAAQRCHIRGQRQWRCNNIRNSRHWHRRLLSNHDYSQQRRRHPRDSDLHIHRNVSADHDQLRKRIHGRWHEPTGKRNAQWHGSAIDGRKFKRSSGGVVRDASQYSEFYDRLHLPDFRRNQHGRRLYLHDPRGE